MRKITFYLITAILMGFAINGNTQERCSMEAHMEEMMQDPEYAKQYNDHQKTFKKRLEQYLNNSEYAQRGGTIEIPVAVHFPNASESERACLEALAQNQIDILNADYTATNTDIASWNAVSGSFPGTNTGIANISFCIATSNHPVGLDPELLEGNPCITIGYDFGGGNNVDSNWSGYLNFVVRPLTGGILGFSPLGGSVAAGQAVTMNTNTFGSGVGCTSVTPQAPYNLGRTTTHELGHFFNLEHTFNGDGNGNCGVGGDGIADTPEVANSTYGCPAPTSVNSCTAGQPALIMNYMDYANDACMYMFSAGQISVAEAYISTMLQPSFKPNVCQVATPGFTLTANDTELFSCPTTDTEAVFNLSYATILGFSENTTFTATGLPLGATATFSPTSLNSNGSFALTVGNLGATAQGTYTITITGTSAPSGVTESVDVILNNNCTSIQCNTYSRTAVNGAIADGLGTPTTPQNGPPFVDTLNVPDDLTIESLKLSVNITHTYVGDLLVRLIHPDGTTQSNVWLGNCSNNQNINVTFEDGAPAIVCASPTTGTYAPEEDLSVFNGLSSQGDWEILIADFFQGDTGTLVDWSIEICSEQPLSIEEENIDNLTIYPNPNNGEFNIGFNPKSGEEITVQVYDIRGRAIFTKSYNSVSRFEEAVRLNQAQSGIYLLSISDGPQKITKKIIVE